MSCCVRIANLLKRYGRILAVDHLNLDVAAGEVLGLLGPNGAGKSTTLYMLAGLVRPTFGSVSIFGEDLRSHFVAIAPRMGVLIERPSFYDYLTARENLLVSARLANVGRELFPTYIDRALDRAGLLSAAHKRVGTFSQGMRQRLGLAQALLLDPELLILDEPTSGLDPEGTAEVLRQLRELARERNVTIVISSHMLHEVEELCDRVAILNEGRLMNCARIDALLSYDPLHAELLVDAPESAANRLAEQPWVASVEARPGKLLVALQEPELHRLTAFLVTEGYRVTAIMPARRTLQDYFLDVTNSSAPASVIPTKVGIQDTPVGAPPPPPDSRLRGNDAFGRIALAYRVEIAKALRRRMTYLGPLLLAVAVVSMALARPVAGDGLFDYGFVAYATPVALNLLGLLILLMYCAALVSSELGNGSACLMLVRPLRRAEWVAAKLLLGMTYAVALAATVAIASWIVVLVRGGATGVVIGGELLYTNIDMPIAYGLGLALVLLPLFASAAYAIMISCCARSTGAAIGTAVGIWLFTDIVKYPLKIDRYLFSSYLETPWQVFNGYCNGLSVAWFPDAAYVMGISAIYLILFSAIAALVMSRRDLRA